MKVFVKIYSAYVILCFVVLFIFFFPWLLLFATRNQWHRYALRADRYWSFLFFNFVGIKYKIKWNFKPLVDQQYILCANHFSYLDIATVGLLGIPSKFVGKSSLSSIPLFGYMYRKIHVTVNRNSISSKKHSFELSKKALDQGFNLTFFPEGGILTTHPPKMVSFKNGAFALSVEKGIPVLPIAFLDNYKVLPDNGKLLFNRHSIRIIVFSPIYPQAKNSQEVDRMRELTAQIIQNELDMHG